MKTQSFSEKKHNLMSSIASMSAQIELLKRKKEFESFDADIKQSIERLSEKMTSLGLQLKLFFEEVKQK